MDNYVQPEKKPGRSAAGCFVIFIMMLAVAGLLVWLLLWSRSVPAGAESAKPLNEQPQTPR